LSSSCDARKTPFRIVAGLAGKFGTQPTCVKLIRVSVIIKLHERRMVRPELIKGLEAVVGSCITMSGVARTERIDPCRLHAALMGGAKGYVRSANLEADEFEPGESADACSQRGRSVMASKLAQMRLAEGSSAEGGRSPGWIRMPFKRAG
jgi:hypothetical protein